MVNKHGRHFFPPERKGMWAFSSWLCFSDADWLGRQTPITWLERIRPSLFFSPQPVDRSGLRVYREGDRLHCISVMITMRVVFHQHKCQVISISPAAALTWQITLSPIGLKVCHMSELYVKILFAIENVFQWVRDYGFWACSFFSR